MPTYFYIIGSPLTDRAGKRKLGITQYPAYRIRQMDTGDCPGEGLEKTYQALFLTRATTTVELLAVEQTIHTQFATQRLRRNGISLSEWFRVSMDDVIDFVLMLPSIERRVTDEEIALIHGQANSDTPDPTAIAAEQNLWEAERIQQPTLKEQFLSIFLKSGQTLRSNQEELWNRFDTICQSNPSQYRGILQWPTATGKTLGELALILIAYARHLSSGRKDPFRCLLIAPQNSILDTQMKTIRKMSHFGLTICEGHNARLSSLHIPRDKHVLVTATHASLTDSVLMAKFPAFEMIHYDEVHRICGDIFFELLGRFMETWHTRYLTGTSATPETADLAQNKKLQELFGGNVLHRVDMEDAITNGWIARPRFSVDLLPKGEPRPIILHKFLQRLRMKIEEKRRIGNWQGGKVIAYLPFQDDVRAIRSSARSVFPNEWFCYSAVEPNATDDEFLAAATDGTPRVLFACERYREGSDIYGLEMTEILMGNTIASNVAIQVCGRALRRDYPEKEGWCGLVRPSEPGETEDDVLDTILLEITLALGKGGEDTTNGDGGIGRLRTLVRVFLGDVVVNGKTYSVEETVGRLQALLERRVFERGVPREKYGAVQAINRELGLMSRDAYFASLPRRKNPIENPPTYFATIWTNWYDFLGIDCNRFPHTKTDWVRVCQERGLLSWRAYQVAVETCVDLPKNPAELYSDFTNWDRELGIREAEEW